MPSVPSLEIATDAPQPTSEPGVRFNLNIPGLAFDGFLQMQAILTGRHMRKPRFDSGLVAFAILVFVGSTLLALGALIAVIVATGTPAGGGGLALVPIVGIIATVYAVARRHAARQDLNDARRLYDGMHPLLGRQQLLLADAGFTVHNDIGHHFVRWDAVSDLVLRDGVWFIVVQGGSAQWLPEATIRASTAPNAVRQFLQTKTGK
jgi:hypothetical protein